MRTLSQRFWLTISAGTLLALCFSPTSIAQKKKDKASEKSLRVETSDRYLKKWLNKDVTYIISREEKKAFKQLTTDEERYQFIEQFWLRRDPNPDTIENETRDEHYRRIAYANERFSSGQPGWMTDRGRIYITFGVPDQIESHPTGGHYQRPCPSKRGEGRPPLTPMRFGATGTWKVNLWVMKYLSSSWIRLERVSIT